VFELPVMIESWKQSGAKTGNEWLGWACKIAHKIIRNLNRYFKEK